MSGQKVAVVMCLLLAAYVSSQKLPGETDEEAQARQDAVQTAESKQLKRVTPGDTSPRCVFYIESETGTQAASATSAKGIQLSNGALSSASITCEDGLLTVYGGSDLEPFVPEFTGVTFKLDKNLKGPAIMLKNTQVIIEDSVFSFLRTGSPAPLDLRNVTATIANSTFIGNQGASAGAVNFNSSRILIKDSAFQVNKGGKAGAVLAGTKSHLYMQGTILEDNAGGNGGGMTADKASQVFVVDSQFVSNTATNGAGAYLRSCSKSYIEASIFEKNEATGSGGGLYQEATSGEINDCKFISNSAVIGAGTSVANTKDINIFFSTYESNKGSKGSAGIAMANVKSADIQACTFTKNLGDQGGAIYQDTSNGNIVGSMFDSNVASSTAGAIYRTVVKGNIESCEFDSNTAKLQAGAMYFINSTGTVQDNSFNGNTAALGNAIFMKASKIKESSNKGLADTDVETIGSGEDTKAD